MGIMDKQVFDFECDGCDYQIIRADGEHCQRDPDDKNPLCPLIEVYDGTK